MVRLQRHTVVALLRVAKRLIEEATGNQFDPDAWDEEDNGGILDQINPEDEEMTMWANHIVMFVRAIYGILSTALHDDQPNVISDDLSDF